jgi:hypothetical protein
MDMTPNQLLANERTVRYVFAHHALTVEATGPRAASHMGACSKSFAMNETPAAHGFARNDKTPIT